MSKLNSKKISNLFDDIDEYDLTSNEGYKEFCDALDEIKDNESLKDLFEIFGIDYDSLLDDIDEIAASIHNSSIDENKDTEKKITIDDDTPHFVRPSENLDYDHQLQLHKIVQEYIDTMIKPFNNGTLTDTQINDAYAGLYEFAAWVMNR